jgi:hypothetical protein
MSLDPHYEITRVRQDEIVAPTTHPDHGDDARTSAAPRHRFRTRLGQTIAVLGVCLAAATGVTITGAHAKPHPAKAANAQSAEQLARDIAALEAKGYVQASCTAAGMLMRDYHTGRSALVRW